MIYVVAFGNPFDGVSLVGPFASHESALAYAENAEGDWWIKEIDPPPAEWMDAEEEA
jgi:hypothetical protein